MTRLSLRLRLALAGFAAICVALAAAGFGLTYLFELHVYRTLSDDLDVYAHQIIGGLEVDAAGNVVARREPDDPRFQNPFSGLYWQVAAGSTVLRSRSLWDTELKLPKDHLSEGQTHYHQLVGPGDKLLLVAERRVALRTQQGLEPVRVVVGSDLTRLRQARDAFARNLAPSLAVLALVLACATWAQLTIGLRPLAKLRAEVAGIVSGRTRRLSEQAPREVLPLVQEVNQLLAAQETEMERARGRAADLAHGLKTPLAALAADARLVRREGHGEVADSMDRIGETMRRHVERELARARIRSGAAHGTAAASVRDICDGLIRTLARTEKGERISFENCAAADATAPFEKMDLTEVLGNLLDNATRYAASRVRTSCESVAGRPTICVEDDGPGLAPDLEDLARRRGGRLDGGGNAGLGLAIVQDILDVYGWRMDFSRSDLGGLKVLMRETRLEAPDAAMS